MSKPNKEVQQRESATFAIALGGLGLVAWIVPLVGVPIAATTIIMAVKGIKFSRAKVALALAVVSLVASTVNATIGALQGYYKQPYDPYSASIPVEDRTWPRWQ